jgi:ABC-type polysaccharide/polyol phosphate transport system ATPase subunit
VSPEAAAASGNGRRPVAIEARGLTKSFAVPAERLTTFKERAVRPRSWLRARSRSLPALQDVSFDVHRGEFFGVIGRNGSGKSTLLKALASIYGLDGGSIRIAGRLAPFIELGVGFNPELPARDNVVLNGVMMGLSPAEARARYDAVIDYAELWDYTELKLKNYSSGMHVRLAFSLMIQVDAEILLVDEVLAVGDAAFQQKCKDSLRVIHEQGTTVVLVTHDMSAVESHCDRAMLIEDGRIELIGDPRDVAERYIEVLFPGKKLESEGEEEAGGARALAAWLTNEGGEPTEAAEPGEPVTVNLKVSVDDDLDSLRLYLELINNPEGVRIAALSLDLTAETGPLAAGEEISIGVRVENPVGPGNYRFSYFLASRDPDGIRILDRCAEPIRLKVLGERAAPGIITLDHSVTVERGVRGARP